MGVVRRFDVSDSLAQPIVCARHEEQINDLRAWQARQNGSLQRLEDKMDSLRNWLMGAVFSALLCVIGIVFSLLQHSHTAK